MTTAATQPLLPPWLQRVFERTAATLDDGHLGHALLICGPALIGKRHLAQRLAAHALGVQHDPRARHLFATGNHPDYRLISFIPTRDGSKLRNEIVIEQIRELGETLALSAQYGNTQVAIIDPADALGHAAGNALLKTLEEPLPGRYLWLISTEPERLPATIRSRCQRLTIDLPPRAEALDWLHAQDHALPLAEEALTAARGHPGLADAWLKTGGLELRRTVASELAALRRGDIIANELAQRWHADELLAERLHHAADLAVIQATHANTPHEVRHLAAWFDHANRVRALLHTPIRAELAVTEWLLRA